MSHSVMIVPRDNQVISQAEWVSMNPAVKEMAIDIAKSIKEAHEKIAKAKDLAEKAPTIKGGFLDIGKQKKVNKVLSEAQIMTNEAMYDLSELIQKSTSFTLQSVKRASDMQKALAYLAINGICDANGRVETLSLECTESINTIIQHAQDFIKQQDEIEDRQNELHERMEDQETKDREQDKALKDMEKMILQYSDKNRQHEQKLSDLQKIIQINQSVNKERIKTLETELREVITANRLFDEEERNRLKDEYRADVLKMKSTFIITCGFIALIAVAALVLSIVL